MVSLAAVLIVSTAWLENIQVDNGETRFPPPTAQMMRGYLDLETGKHFAARRERVDGLTGPEDIAAYAAEKRAAFVSALGGFPERTPLNAQVVGTGAAEGYRFEKVLFESQPGFHVSGILYLPTDTSKPVPGVIVPCGHSANGKALEAYQRASIILAMNGIASFCYDPIGQGERYFYLKEDGTPELGTTVEHTMIGTSAILTGTNIAMLRIWDGMRALDYLETRPEIDAKRLGCTGNSGGGTLTSYLMALDDRIQCAAASCYLTSFERLLATIGPQDAEQDIFGEISSGIDHGDFILMRAPKPTLICSATKDFFDIKGTWSTFREAKQVYSKAGFSERVDLIENFDEHGFHKPQREAMARWMRRWLSGVDEVIVEKDFAVHTDAELQCSPQGQVKLMPGERTVFDLLREREEKLAAQRAAVPAEELRGLVAKKVRYSPSNSDVPCYQKSDADTAGHLTLRIYPEVPGPGLDNPQGIAPKAHDIVLEASIVLPPDAVGEVRLCLRPEGRAAVDAEGAAEPGVAKVFVDLRGTGATKPDDESHGWDGTVGAEWPSFFRAYLIGKSYTGMWIGDIVETARAARHALGVDGASLSLDAKGFTTIPALHAAALEPELFAKTALDGGIPTWRAVVAEPRAKQQLFSAVNGALEVYDLDQLPALAAPESVTITNPVVPVF